MAGTFVLVHSPLVGPSTWAFVADALRERGCDAVVPDLRRDDGADSLRLHVSAVDQAVLAAGVAGRGLVVVGHSGAGPMLPALGQHLGARTAGYLFVDAQVPRDGASRLDLLASDGDRQAFLERVVDGALRPWSEDDLREEIVDDDRRSAVAGELRPLPIAVYEEPLPVPADWPDRPAGYLRLSPWYDDDADAAEEAGWPVDRLVGGHFQVVNEPDVVADAIVGLERSLRV